MPIIIKTDSVGNSCTAASYVYDELTASVTESTPGFQLVPVLLLDSLGIDTFSFTSQTFTHCSTYTGLETLSNINEIKISPNPANENVLISCKDILSGNLYITDMTGRVVMQLPFNTQAQLNTSILTQGIYIAEVKDANGRSVKGKLVKE